MATQDEIVYFVGYEWWMFRAMRWALEKGIPFAPHKNDPVRNAVADSLAIHGRALISFFWGTKKQTTDLHVTDLGLYAPPWPPPPVLLTWHTDTNKRVAHLTESHADPVIVWNVAAAQTELEPRIEALRVTLGPAALANAKWTGDADPASRLLVPSGAAAVGLGQWGATGAIGPLSKP
jgi:hypothetical protein